MRVIISGRVQGVGYRAWTVREASNRNLKGWVRNRREGTVEAVFCGSDNIIDDMLQACRKGPMIAKVDGIERFSADECDEIFAAKPTL